MTAGVVSQLAEYGRFIRAKDRCRGLHKKKSRSEARPLPGKSKKAAATQPWLRSWKESYTDGGWDCDGFVCGGELPGGRVDAEFDDGVGVLIFGEKEMARGIDGEVAGFLAASGDVGNLGKCSLLRIDG